MKKQIRNMLMSGALKPHNSEERRVVARKDINKPRRWRK